MTAPLDDDQYRELLAARTTWRRFLHWSDEQATAAGVTPQQHQVVLAVRGHPGPERATVGDVAAHLVVRHHSAVELVDRTERAGLVRRVADRTDGRVVRLVITARGRRLLARLAALHRDELARLAPAAARLERGRSR